MGLAVLALACQDGLGSGGNCEAVLEWRSRSQLPLRSAGTLLNSGLASQQRTWNNDPTPPCQTLQEHPLRLLPPDCTARASTGATAETVDLSASAGRPSPLRPLRTPPPPLFFGPPTVFALLEQGSSARIGNVKTGNSSAACQTTHTDRRREELQQPRSSNSKAFPAKNGVLQPLPPHCRQPPAPRQLAAHSVPVALRCQTRDDVSFTSMRNPLLLE